MTPEHKEKLKNLAATQGRKSDNYEDGYISFKAGAKTILDNPGEWGLVPKAQHDYYIAKYTSLAEWYDRLMGTPCEQVRHQQEIESLQAQNDRYRKALEDVIIRLEEDKRFNALSIAKEALKQED